MIGRNTPESRLEWNVLSNASANSDTKLSGFFMILNHPNARVLYGKRAKRPVKFIAIQL